LLLFYHIWLIGLNIGNLRAFFNFCIYFYEWNPFWQQHWNFTHFCLNLKLYGYFAGIYLFWVCVLLFWVPIPQLLYRIQYQQFLISIWLHIVIVDNWKFSRVLSYFACSFGDIYFEILSIWDYLLILALSNYFVYFGYIWIYFIYSELFYHFWIAFVRIYLNLIKTLELISLIYSRNSLYIHNKPWVEKVLVVRWQRMPARSSVNSGCNGMT
jgi:hypothetical protein